MRRALSLAFVCVALGCSDASDSAASLRGAVEIASRAQVFQPTSSLAARRDADARFREIAARASGTLLVPQLEAGSGAAQWVSGVRVRGTCGVTFVSESYAVTAAHCVDPASSALAELSVEMYRPGANLDERWQSASALSGTFPDYQHARLGDSDGYFTDRFACRLAARCSAAYGGPYNCSASASSGGDTALLHCSGRPGARYGYVEVASADLAAASILMPWAHEVYDVPLEPSDDRFVHYVAYDGTRAHNYHYLGADTSGSERNQLLPLLSSDGKDGAPHTKVQILPEKVVTDILGCHGSSGSGALQQESDGSFALLGPFAAGDSETESYLCDHVPALDGSARGWGKPGLAYQPLSLTHALLSENAGPFNADCAPLAAGVTSLFTQRSCARQALASDTRNAAFAASLIPGRVALESNADWLVSVQPNTPLELHGFELEAGASYRLGVRLSGNEPCGGATCGRLEVSLGQGARLLQAGGSVSALSLATTFVADASGSVPLHISATAATNAFGAITLKRDGAVNHFDSANERWQAALIEPDTTEPIPMRFTGDGRSGFAARLLSRERMLLTREALAAGRAWAARFTLSGSSHLTCGLLADDGSVALSRDCSEAFVALDDRAGQSARAAFFIENSGDDPALIDDLGIASDASPDSDRDGIPDAVDICPRGPLPATGELGSDLASVVTVAACAEGPARVEMALPTASNACEAGVFSARLVSVGGVSIPPVPFPLLGDHVALELPLGTHEAVWDFADRSGRVLASFTQKIEVTAGIDKACCKPLQSLVEGTGASDVLTLKGIASACAFTGYGRDLLVSDGYGDFIAGGPDADYLLAGGGDSVVVSGLGNDFVGGGVHGDLTVYTGAGDDFVDGSLANSLTVYAGSGALVAVGSPGSDRFFVGSQTAMLFGGAGDDTFTLRSPCESHAGLRLDGGPGRDTLVTALPPSELERAGVIVLGFENIVVDSTEAYLSTCFATEARP